MKKVINTIKSQLDNLEQMSLELDGDGILIEKIEEIKKLVNKKDTFEKRYYKEKMKKRFNIELGIFLHELSKNTFDCDGFDLLNHNQREYIRNMIVNKTDEILKLN
tara:strand:+ start:592 stop:909 length:318 start_codon:yes stop_codon:yes gene_type:complete